MKLEHCKRCKKIYSRIRTPYCPDCVDEIEKQFDKIREYIDKNPKANMGKILEDTGVEKRILLFLLKDQRLSISGNADFKCERCAKSISSGRYCSSCSAKLSESFSKQAKKVDVSRKAAAREKTVKDDKKDDSKGMHILK